MKKILAVSTIASFVLAKSIVVLPFGAYINYGGDTVKDKGYVGGVYLSYYDKVLKYNSGFKYELNLENDYIKYKDDIKPFRSFNTTFIFNWYYGLNYAFKAGINHQKIYNSGEDQHANVYILGAEYYQYLKYNFGMDYYRTNYETLHINQLTPYVGYNFGNYYSAIGSFYAEAKYNYIFSGEELNTKKHYHNVDLKLVNYKGKFTTTLRASLGKSAYKVEKGGIVFYSTGDEYKNSYGLDVAYSIDNTSSIKVGYTRSSFTDVGSAHSNTFLVEYAKSF